MLHCNINKGGPTLMPEYIAIPLAVVIIIGAIIFTIITFRGK